MPVAVTSEKAVCDLDRTSFPLVPSAHMSFFILLCCVSFFVETLLEQVTVLICAAGPRLPPRTVSQLVQVVHQVKRESQRSVAMIEDVGEGGGGILGTIPFHGFLFQPVFGGLSLCKLCSRQCGGCAPWNPSSTWCGARAAISCDHCWAHRG